MKFFPLKLWQNDKGFTLLETLIIFSLLQVFVVMVMNLLLNFSQAMEANALLIEKNETIYAALDQLKMLTKHGHPLALTDNSYRLRIAMGKNTIEVYPNDSSLLVKNLGTANPILEHCQLREPPFALDKLENGKIQVEVTLDFTFSDDSSEHLDLTFLSWCEEVIP